MIELHHLHHFYEVAKAGSFTAAARSLHVSQSALSKTVALLEAREGIQLLQRSKTGVILTPLGKEVFDQAERIFHTVHSIQTTFRSHKEICEGLLPLGASDHIANYLLAPRSAKLRRLYPKLLPSIFSGAPKEVAELILKNKLEFGLSFTKLGNIPNLVFEPVKSVEMALVYRAENAPTIKTKGNLRDAFGYIGSVRSSLDERVSSELLEALGEIPPVVYETSSQETQKRLCLAGVGFAFLARFMVEEEIKQRKLAEFPFKDPPQLTIYLARKKNSLPSYNAQMFLKAVGFA